MKIPMFGAGRAPSSAATLHAGRLAAAAAKRRAKVVEETDETEAGPEVASDPIEAVHADASPLKRADATVPRGRKAKSKDNDKGRTPRKAKG